MTNIYPQINYINNSISPVEHLDTGLKQEKLGIYDQTKQEDEFIISKTLKKFSESQIQIQTKNVSVMQELVVIIKKKTLKDKLNSLKKPIQKQLSSKISDPVLIGKDQDLSPFWNKSTQEQSVKLWCPTKTDYVDLEVNLLNGSSKKLMLNSWYSTKVLEKKTCLENSQMIYLRSLQSLLPKTMELEQESTKDNVKKTNKKILKKNQETDKLPAAKAKLIQIYPTKHQKITLKKWFGIRRWIYNKCLDAVNKKVAKLTLKDLRDKIINNKNFQTENTWMLDYEYDLRDEALSDLLKNYNSNFAKDKSFNIKFISKKQPQSLSVLSKKWNKPRNFYSDIFKPEKLKSNEIIPKKLNYTSRLKKTQLNKYYLCIPEPLNQVGENQALGNMIFIDPGVKTFLTGYDPSGRIIQWGEKDIGVIARLQHYKNKLQSKIKLQSGNKIDQRESVYMFKSSKRYKMSKAILRINERIYNLVNELHKKLSLWLVENYQYIFIPRLNFHKCKKLNRKSKAKMAAYRHCAFIDRLKDKTRETQDSHVVEVNEAFTSKTCSKCGNQHESLRNKDIYECSNCKLKIGRDINASKNVMLRYFTKRVSLDIV